MPINPLAPGRDTVHQPWGSSSGSHHQGKGGTGWAGSGDSRRQAEQAQREKAYGKHYPRVDSKV